MKRSEPIVEDFNEGMAAIRARGLVSNLYRYGLPAIGAMGVLGANYAGLGISDAISIAVENDMGVLSPEARTLYGEALTQAVDGFAADVNGLIERTGTFFAENRERFRDGSLILHHEQAARDLPMGGVLVDAFRWATEAKPGADTLHEKYGPAVVGVASMALTIGAAAYKGADIIQGGLNAMAFSWSRIREGVARGVDRMRGINPPDPMPVFDPFQDPAPDAMSGDPDREQAVVNDLADRYEKMGAPAHVAHDVACEQVASISSAGHRLRDLERENAEKDDRIAAMEEEIGHLRDRVARLSDDFQTPQARREEIISVLRDMGAEPEHDPERGEEVPPVLH